jgi:tetratricopeptide (TPR) repeat protein
MGNTLLSKDYYERALAIKREVGHRGGECSQLSSLGNHYGSVGEPERAMDYFQQALAITREMGAKGSEERNLLNIARVLIDLGRFDEAIEKATEAVSIGKEMGTPLSYANGRLARAYLYAGDLQRARDAVEAAREYDEPWNNGHILLLLGIIAVRQGDKAVAHKAFMEAAEWADVMLERDGQSPGQLETKAMALCGITICGGGDHVAAARKGYKAARRMNKDVGSVRRELRLFDALAEADEAGVLAGVRAAAAGE